MTRKEQVYRAVCQYITEYKGNAPSLRDLFEYMMPTDETITQWIVNDAIMRLRVEKVLDRDERGHLIVVGASVEIKFP